MSLDSKRGVDASCFVEKQSSKEYTEADSEKWRIGTERFRQFWQYAGETIRDRFPESIGQLQALFLYEKPAMMDPVVQFFSDELRTLGFVVERDIAYTPVLVKTIVETHHDEYISEFGTVNTTVIVRKMAHGKKTDHHHTRGLVLGFPEAAISVFHEHRRYKEEQVIISHLFMLLRENQDTVAMTAEWMNKRPIELLPVLKEKLSQYQLQLGITEADIAAVMAYAQAATKTQLINVYGNRWLDTKPLSEESLQKQKRLKTAFDASSILRIVNEFDYVPE